MVGIQAARDRTHHLVVPDQELEVQLLRQLEGVQDLAVNQNEAQPSFMILVSICGMK